MQLLRLSVRDFGVFRGTHEFELGATGDGTRNVTLITGLNGAGKSTLFEALGLALYGRFWLGTRVRQQAYADYLLTRLHRQARTAVAAAATEGGVAVTFEYVRSGRVSNVSVERQWRRRDSTVDETLLIANGDSAIDAVPEDYQAWLNQLVPLGLAPLCFLDTERMDRLGDPQRSAQALGDTLQGLLGLDIVTRLAEDLRAYTRRRGSGRDIRSLRRRLSECRAALTEVENQLSRAKAQDEALDERQSELEAQLTQAQYRLAAEGGTYAARRALLEEQQRSVEMRIQQASAELSELAAGLLPFSLTPRLCDALEQRLETEAAQRRAVIAKEFWEEQLAQIQSRLKATGFWDGLGISVGARDMLIKRLTELLQSPIAAIHTPEARLVHRLAEPDQAKLQEWISQARGVIVHRVEWLGEQLVALRGEHERVREELSRAPDDEVLAPIHHELEGLRKALGDIRQQRDDVRARLAILEYQCGEQARLLERTEAELRAAQVRERQLALAYRSRDVLRAYAEALMNQRVRMLESALVTSFNSICRKDHLLSAAHIDSDGFRVHLEGAGGGCLDAMRFSAGERQLYALALLWALRQVSGRQLPLAIDTPLARLDEVHRERLIREYVPKVSHQVLLFATSAELGDGLEGLLHSRVARKYHLEYDGQSEETCVYREEPATQEAVPARRAR